MNATSTWARRGLLAVAALVLAACAGGGGDKPTALGGTYWNVLEVDGAEFKADKDQRDPHLRLDLQHKRATGYGGVNSFFGNFETSDVKLQFGPIAATRRAGPPAAMAFESAFLKALEATRSYRISGDRLELLDAEGRVRARLEALPAV